MVLAKKSKKFKVIITISPNSDILTIKKHLMEGNSIISTFLRINGSHSDFNWVKHVVEYFSDCKISNRIFYDIPNRKMRLKGKGKFKRGEAITFHTLENKGIFVKNLSGVIGEIKVNDILVVDDGRSSFKVLDIQRDKVVAVALDDGEFRENCGVWIRGKPISGYNNIIEEFSRMSKIGIEKYMISFASDTSFFKKIYKRENFHFMAKIEDKMGFKNLDILVRDFNSICVARGDFGANLSYPEWILLEREIIKRCVKRGSEVFLAGEIFISSIYRDIPSRAEVSDFFTHLEMGIDGIILSDESVYGKNLEKLLLTINHLVSGRV